MDLQELIMRGRLIFSGAPERLKVFTFVDGRRNAGDFASLTHRHVNSIHRDLRRLSDAGFIQERAKAGQPVMKKGSVVYEKTPLARTVPLSYFNGSKRVISRKAEVEHRAVNRRKSRPQPLSTPNENEILDICKSGEDQTVEFKAAGTEVRKVTREIAALLNTREGGIILYGVDDDGIINGTDLNRQKFDQPLQNSIKHSIAPAAVVTLRAVRVLGTEILVVVVPPWNRSDVYQFDEKPLIRKGTNVFGLKPEELKKLHRGEYVI